MVKSKFLDALFESARSEDPNEEYRAYTETSEYTSQNPESLDGMLPRMYTEGVSENLIDWPKEDRVPARVDCIYSLLGLKFDNVVGILCKFSQGEELSLDEITSWKKIQTSIADGLEQLPEPENLESEVREAYGELYQKAQDAYLLIGDTDAHENYIKLRFSIPKEVVRVYAPLIGNPNYEIQTCPEEVSYDPEGPFSEKENYKKTGIGIIGFSALALFVMNPELRAPFMGLSFDISFAGILDSLGTVVRYGLPSIGLALGYHILQKGREMPGGLIEAEDGLYLAEPFSDFEPEDKHTVQLRVESRRHPSAVQQRNLYMRRAVNEPKQVLERKVSQITEGAGKSKSEIDGLFEYPSPS